MRQANTTPEPTVFVVDDDQDMRAALQWLIESVGLRVETYPSAEDFLAAGGETRPGCLLLDIRMPGMGGMRLLEHLHRSAGYVIPTIILTGHGDVRAAVRTLKTGAIDFIEKPAIDHELLERVQDALDKDRSRRDGAREMGHISGVLDRLTTREWEVLDRLVAGESNKALAFTLDLSERTVEKYRRNIMAKTQASSFAQLVRMVVLYRQSAENTAGGHRESTTRKA